MARVISLLTVYYNEEGIIKGSNSYEANRRKTALTHPRGPFITTNANELTMFAN
jgi:hypothetical protein